MTRSLAPAAQIAAGLSPESDLMRRACDALDNVADEYLERWGSRSAAYMMAPDISNPEFVALTKDDSVALAMQRKKRGIA